MKEKILQKLYYGGFNHKATIISRQPYQIFHGKKKEFNKSPFRSSVEEFVSGYLDKDEFRIRENFSYLVSKETHYTVSVYFKNPSIIKRLEEEYGNFFIELEKPLNDNHTEVLEKDKVITRKSLFHDKFRYCFRCSYDYQRSRTDQTDIFKEMVVWVEDNMKDKTKNEDYKIFEGFGYNFYFAHPNDAMMFKMIWHDYIKSTERIRLISEIEDE